MILSWSQTEHVWYFTNVNVFCVDWKSNMTSLTGQC